MSRRRRGRRFHRHYGILSFTFTAIAALVVMSGVLVFAGVLR
jgi:hypothetical protein